MIKNKKLRPSGAEKKIPRQNVFEHLARVGGGASYAGRILERAARPKFATYQHAWRALRSAILRYHAGGGYCKNSAGYPVCK